MLYLKFQNSAVCCPSALSNLKSFSGSIFELESGNDLTDTHMTRWMDVNMTRQMDGHQFQKQPSQGGVLQLWFQIVGGNVFQLESGKHNMDRCVQAPNRQTGGHKLTTYTRVYYCSNPKLKVS